MVEILMGSHSVTVPEIAGDRSYTIPDIHATAIRVKDAKVLGQTTSADITGKGGNAVNFARYFDVREISEATALALMEDMLMEVPE